MMHADRYDALTRQLGHIISRRAALRSLGAGVLAALLARPQPAAAACLANGRRCTRRGQCCSGICKREDKKIKGRRPKKQCARNEDARGCTIEGGCGTVACPEFGAGACTVTVDGKPFCATIMECHTCSSHEECVTALDSADARCVNCPLECGEAVTFRACVSFTQDSSR